MNVALESLVLAAHWQNGKNVVVRRASKQEPESAITWIAIAAVDTTAVTGNTKLTTEPTITSKSRCGRAVRA